MRQEILARELLQAERFMYGVFLLFLISTGVAFVKIGYALAKHYNPPAPTWVPTDGPKYEPHPKPYNEKTKTAEDYTKFKEYLNNQIEE